MWMTGSSASCRATVGARPPDRPAPGYAAHGGDLSPAVEATAEVVVLVLQVFDDELEAVGAGGHRDGLVGVDLCRCVPTAWGCICRRRPT